MTERSRPITTRRVRRARYRICPIDQPTAGGCQGSLVQACHAGLTARLARGMSRARPWGNGRPEYTTLRWQIEEEVVGTWEVFCVSGRG